MMNWRIRRLMRCALFYVGISIAILWAIAPIFWVFISSISTRDELYTTPIKNWIPKHPTLQNYIELFTVGARYRAGASLPTARLLVAGLRNSLLVSVASATILTLLATLVGYTFARLRFQGKNYLFGAILFMMPLPVWISLISLYFLFSKFGLINNNFGLILLYIAQGFPLALWLMTTYIRELPPEIEEAAQIDGCSPLLVVRHIVFPLARPAMISVFLVAFLTAWNAFLIPVIFTSTEISQPITVILSLFIGQYEVAWEAMSAAAMITMIPPILLAMLFQRYIIRGLTLGASIS